MKIFRLPASVRGQAGVLMVFLLAISQSLFAASYQGYDIYLGDLDGDGDSDYYFHSERTFVLVGVDIPIPVFVDGPSPFALFFDSATQTYSQSRAYSLTDDQIREFGLTLANLNNHYAVLPDMNGDGVEDLFIQGAGSLLNGLVIASLKGQIPTAIDIPDSGILTLPSGELILSDYNGDGNLDLYVAGIAGSVTQNAMIAYGSAIGRLGGFSAASVRQNQPKARMLKDGSYYQGELAAARFSKFSAAGKVLWSMPFGLVYARPLVDEKGTVYTASSNGRVYAATAAGELLWSVKTRGPLLCDPLWGSDLSRLYLVTDNGWIYIIDSANGQVLGELNLSFTTGVKVNGSMRFNAGFDTLYLRDSLRKLYAVKVSVPSQKKSANAATISNVTTTTASSPALLWVQSLGQ